MDAICAKHAGMIGVAFCPHCEIEKLRQQLAAANHLIAEQNKLNKERQDWALHTNTVIRGLNEQLATALAAIEAKDRGLDKLARLGNEPYLGNSVGNTIAAEFLSIKPDASALRQHDNALIELVGYRAQAGELERLKELLRTNFMDDHLRIDLHFKDYHIRKLVRVDARIDFTHIIGAMTREMWEDLNGALVRSGVTK